MVISYNRLWKLLIDNHMIKKDLKEKAELSTATMAKLGKNESVSLDVLVRICKVLNCEIGDVVEIVKSKCNCQVKFPLNFNRKFP